MVAPNLVELSRRHDGTIRMLLPESRRAVHVHMYDHSTVLYWASMGALVLGCVLMLIACAPGLCTRWRKPKFS